MVHKYIKQANLSEAGAEVQTGELQATLIEILYYGQHGCLVSQS